MCSCLRNLPFVAVRAHILPLRTIQENPASWRCSSYIQWWGCSAALQSKFGLPLLLFACHSGLRACFARWKNKPSMPGMPLTGIKNIACLFGLALDVQMRFKGAGRSSQKAGAGHTRRLGLAVDHVQPILAEGYCNFFDLCVQVGRWHRV